MSYVTGSHFFKAGVTVETGTNGPTSTDIPRDMTLLFVNRVPNRITLQIQPRFVLTKLNQATGVFVTDRWTKKRLTVNLGLRFDYNNGSVPAQDQPAGRFLAARHFDEVPNVPAWKDLSPRVGVAYESVWRWKDRGEGLVEPVCRGRASDVDRQCEQSRAHDGE